MVDEDSFPSVATTNTLNETDLKEALAIEKDKEHALILKIKKSWVSKKCLLLMDEPLALIAREKEERRLSIQYSR